VAIRGETARRRRVAGRIRAGVAIDERPARLGDGGARIHIAVAPGDS
jgi:hypothetical protein